MKALVAIVGRPNVGKSTLFNRMARRRLAIVEDIPGVTRDRHYAEVELGDKCCTLIDTGGFVPGEKDELLAKVREQAQLAVEECDIILFAVDGRAGISGADQEVATYLRKSGKPVIVVVNKLDNARTHDTDIAEFHQLGLGDPVPVSAEHALGLTLLQERIYELLPAAPAVPALAEGEIDAPPPDAPIRVAIVGRPNVGKSTLINALLKENRMIASETPGTTRDPIDSELTYKDRRYVLTDTAGIRRKKTIAQRMETFAVVASLRVIERSDVAVVLLDATEPAVDQDAKLAGIAQEKGRALIVVVNKWDKVAKSGGSKETELRDELKLRLKFVAYAPVLFTSALTGSKVEKVLDLAAVLFDQFHYRAPTPQLNRLLDHMTDSHPAPMVSGRPLRLYYIAQVSSAPPTFAITCNRPDGVPDSYKRYIVNQIRDTFDLRVPILLYFRERPGRAKRDARKNPGKKTQRPRRRQ
jgi:GTPase